MDRKAHHVLSIVAADSGIELSAILAQPKHHLGYIPAKVAAKLHLRHHDIPAEIIFSPDGGESRVCLNLKEAQSKRNDEGGR
jgi:hypothetical protein